MKDFKKKLIPIIGISLASVTMIASISTMAYFVINQNVTQNIYPDGGEMKKTVFLDPGNEVWDLGYDELYYAYVWKSSSVSSSGGPIEAYLVPAKGVELDLSTKEIGSTSFGETVSRTVHVFEFDSITFDRVIFTRMNPASVELNSNSSMNCEVGDANWWNGSSNGSWLWGRTDDITYNPSYNYYRIDYYANPGQSKVSKYSYGTINRSGQVTISGNNH